MAAKIAEQSSKSDRDEDPPDEPPASFVAHSMSPWLTMYVPLLCSMAAWLGLRHTPDIYWAPWALVAGVVFCLIGISDSLVPLLFSGLAVLAWGAATQWLIVPRVDRDLVEVFIWVSGGGFLTGLFMTLGTRYEIRPGAIVVYKGPFRGRETIPVKNIATALLPRGPRQWLLNSGDVQLDLGGRKLVLKDVFVPNSVEGKLRALGF